MIEKRETGRECGVQIHKEETLRTGTKGKRGKSPSWKRGVGERQKKGLIREKRKKKTRGDAIQGL